MTHYLLAADTGSQDQVRTPTRHLTELDRTAVDLVMHSVDMIMRYRAYTPGGGMLVILLGKFRDDVWETRHKTQLPRIGRGTQHLPLAELDLSQVDALIDSATALIDRFGPYMDDPALSGLLTEFRDALNFEKTERTKPREEPEQEAKAS
jgi:hypothetical protein